MWHIWSLPVAEFLSGAFLVAASVQIFWSKIEWSKPGAESEGEEWVIPGGAPARLRQHCSLRNTVHTVYCTCPWIRPAIASEHRPAAPLDVGTQCMELQHCTVLYSEGRRARLQQCWLATSQPLSNSLETLSSRTRLHTWTTRSPPWMIDIMRLSQFAGSNCRHRFIYTLVLMCFLLIFINLTWWREGVY